MRRAPDRQEQIAGLFVVAGAAIVFGPVIWLVGREGPGQRGTRG